MRIDWYKAERERAKQLPSGLRVHCVNKSSGFILMVWNPKAIKPTYNVHFRTHAQREAFAKRVISEFEKRQVRSEEYRKERNAGDVSSVEIGAIFSYSWGYEQTNVDYFQVVARTKKMLKLRKIGSEYVDEKSTGNSMAAYVRPVPDNFLDEKIIVKRVFFYGGCPRVSFDHGTGVLVEMKRFGNADPLVVGSQYRSWYA